MKIGMFGLIGAAAFATAANAAFTGYVTEIISLGSGNKVMNVYASFSNANDRVLNVYNTAITTNNASGFFQSAGNPFWKAGNTQNKATSDDSWVAIGSNPNGSGNAGGNGGSVVGDPNFVNFDDANDSTDFSFIEGIGGGAGWYNGSPANTYGYAFDAGRVLLAHFVFAGSTSNTAVSWSVSMAVTFAGDTSATSGVGQGANTFLIPAPGALALLGVAGLSSRRRRA